jgi:HD-like signal output (HDOD) protein
LTGLEKIIQYAEDFPTLPTIYSTLLDLMSDSRTTVSDVANIISKDQSSTIKVLKAINSSVYALQKRVDTVSQAIFYLGFNEVKNLLLALSVINMFSSHTGLKNFNLVDFWKHSIAVGVISRILGKLTDSANIENYFLCGLLHDIGKLLFIKYIQADYIKVLNHAYDNNMEIRESETLLLGTNHALAGELLLDKWKLPQTIKTAVKGHHIGITTSSDKNILACVHLADIIALTMNLGTSGSNMIPKPNEEIWNIIKLPEGVLQGLVPHININYQDSIRILLLN